MTFYDQLFGDQTLEEVVTEMEFPAGSPLEVARARMWEGNYTESALAAQGAQEPWASFIQSAARMRAGLNAKAQLLPIAEDAWKESRARLLAWTALRKLGEKPSPVHNDEVLGVIIEVPMDGKLDVLAAYADGSARYLGHGDELKILEPTEPDPKVIRVIAEAFPLLKVPPKPRDPDAAGPDSEHVRLSALTAQGTHMDQVEWSEVEPGGRYDPLFAAAIQLLQYITER